MPEIQLKQRLLGTDRGELHLAAHGGQECLIRLLDGAQADLDFKAALRDLQRDMRAHPAPRILPILDHDFVGDYYYIEYRLDGHTESVVDYFARTHWLERLRFIRSLTTIYPNWKQVPKPMGLHAGRLVACRLGGEWVAHLAPCPRIPLESPHDLIRSDAHILAAIAPERLRGLESDGIAEDVYALSTLAFQALGARTFIAAGRNAEQWIETQARGSSALEDLSSSSPERILWQIPSVEQRLRRLEDILKHYRASSPGARPRDLRKLGQVLDAVLELEHPLAVATELKQAKRPDEGLQFLDWALSIQTVARSTKAALHEIAADFCRDLDLPGHELRHLDELVKIAPQEVFETRRLELRYDQYMKKPHPKTPDQDKEGTALLDEFRKRSSSADTDKARQSWLRIAMIHRWRGELHDRAAALFEMTKLDNEVESLYLYGLSLRDIEVQTESEEEHTKLCASLSKLWQFAEKRLKGLNLAEVYNDEEVKIWTERFQSLLCC